MKSEITDKDLQQKINKTVSDFSDCSICSLCCIDGTLFLDEKDILRISKYMKIEPKALVEKFTKYNRRTGEVKVDMPCSFLLKNKCIIYPVRPDVCRNYPIFAQKDGTAYVYGIESCARATHFFESFLDFLEKKYPDFYKELQNKIKKSKRLGKGDSINMQFSKEPLALFIKWLEVNLGHTFK